MALVHEDDDLEDRGRLKTWEAKPMMDILHTVYRHEKRAREEVEGDDCEENQFAHARAACIKNYFVGVYFKHITSYNMVSRAPVAYDQPAMTEPWRDLTEQDFKEQTGFCKRMFLACCDELTLLPGKIVASDGCTASKHLAMFTLLRRWSVPDTLERQARDMRRGRCWVTAIINAAIATLMQHYRKLITTFDFVRIKPELDAWADAVAESSPGGTPGVVCWADGKPWLFPKPGTGTTARALATALNVPTDHIQRSLYYRNYRGHGVKVQEIIFADGIKYSLCYSLRRHDSLVMDESKMSLMLDLLFLSDGSVAICVTDQAYKETAHLIAKTRTVTFANLSAAQQFIVQQQDAANMYPRGNIEACFSKHVTLYPGANKVQRQSLFRGGRLRWAEICDCWYAQALWANLHTCCYGNQTNGQTVVPPPTYQDYLKNINAGHYV